MTPAEWLTRRMGECAREERRCEAMKLRGERAWWASMRITLDRLRGYLDPIPSQRALDVPCGHCGAARGETCIGRRQGTSAPHRARLRAVHEPASAVPPDVSPIANPPRAIDEPAPTRATSTRGVVA